jgi:hypothetical protein
MITAVVPVGGQAWFFKIVGPIAAIDKLEKPLNDFFATIQVEADGRPKWNLPEGWTNGPDKPMRLATILVPAEPKPLEIAVSGASWPGTPESVLANVDRWRGQLKLPNTDVEHMGEFIREAKAGDKTIMIVDLRGHYSGGMTPPFAGAGAGAGPGGAAGRPTPGADIPPGHPPVDANSTAPPTAPNAGAAMAPLETPKFTAPKDWQSIPAEGMRKAAFAIGNQEHGALVTVIGFRTTEGPQIGDPLQNVNMWRQGVGLPPIKQDELSKATESLQIDGKTATYARVVPDTSQPGQSQAKLATIAAMVKDGDQLWFVKLYGDRTVVTAQEEAFKTFLKSLRFAASGD